MVPAVRLEHPHVLLPADSNGAPHAIHRRTLMTMGDKPAKRRAIFFCSISLTTLGGRVLILRPSEVDGSVISVEPRRSPDNEPEDADSLLKLLNFPLNISLPRTLSATFHRRLLSASMQKACRILWLRMFCQKRRFQLKSMGLTSSKGVNLNPKVYSGNSTCCLIALHSVHGLATGQ
ncbi:MAG: hypothetical protein RI953_79 [Pseudomonadota bacterium]